jgi:hypothetical protein
MNKFLPRTILTNTNNDKEDRIKLSRKGNKDRKRKLATPKLRAAHPVYSSPKALTRLLNRQTIYMLAKHGYLPIK